MNLKLSTGSLKSLPSIIFFQYSTENHKIKLCLCNYFPLLSFSSLPFFLYLHSLASFLDKIYRPREIFCLSLSISFCCCWSRFPRIVFDRILIFFRYHKTSSSFNDHKKISIKFNQWGAREWDYRVSECHKIH